MKSWESTEVVAGGVIGALDRPSQLVAGRYRDGELVVVGRTSPLTPGRARSSPPSSSPRTTTTPGPTASAPAGSAGDASRCP